MPITASPIIPGETFDNVNPYTTGVWTPVVGRLYLLAVQHKGTTPCPTPSVSGNGLTWILVRSNDVTNRRLTVFRAMLAPTDTPITEGTTISGLSPSQDNASVHIAEVRGVDTGGINGGMAVVVAGGDQGSSTKTGTVNMPAFGSPTNAAFVAIGHNNAEGANPESGYTELGDTWLNDTALYTGYKPTQDTSPSATWATNSNWRGVALELKESLVTAAVVPLNPSASSSGATLSLTAPARVPLASSAAQSAATLALVVAPVLTLASSSASGATLTLVVAPTLTLATSSASSSASLELSTLTVAVVALDPAAAVSGQGSLRVITAPTRVPLNASAASSGSALEVYWPGVPAAPVYITGPVDTATVLLVHCDGADGSRTFVDSSPSAHPLVVYGDGQVDTSWSKFGSGSYYAPTYNGASRIVVPNGTHPDFSLRADDFTLEAFVRYESLPYAAAVISKWSAWDPHSFQWTWNPWAGAWTFSYTTDQATNPQLLSGPWAPTLLTTYHVALVRAGPAIKFFVDGKQIGPDATIGTDSIADSAAQLYVGSDEPYYGQCSMQGWLDEARVSKGIARWTSNFTPPSAPYTAGAAPITAPAQSAATLSLSILAVPVTLPLASSAAVSGAAALTLKTPVGVPLASSAATSGATLALKATPRLPLASSAATSGATLTVTAPTRVPLASSAAQSGGTLTLAVAPTLPLTSSVVSGATLVVQVPTRVPLAASAAVSGGSLFLSATNVPLIGATSTALSGATLTLKTPTTVVLGASAATSSSTLALGVPVKLTLTSAAVSGATLTLTSTGVLVLGASSATSSSTLTLTVAVLVPLDPSAAQSNATLRVGAAGLLILSPAAAYSGATLTARVPVTLPLGPSVVVSSSTLIFKLKARLGPLGVVGPILETDVLEPVLATGIIGPSFSGVVGATWATGATSTSTRTGVLQPGRTGVLEPAVTTGAIPTVEP